MPIDRVRNDGTVFRKKLNAKRPKGSGGPPPPPVYGFVEFFASQLPIPAETVMGDPLAQRNAWQVYVKNTAQVLTFEGLPNLTEFFDSATVRNGVTLSIPMPVNDLSVPLYNYNDTAIVSIVSDGLGRYNTTSGGTNYLNFMATSDGIFPITPLSLTRFEFSPPISCFGTYLTDLGDFNGSISLKLYASDLTTHTKILSNGTGESNGFLTFYGFVDTQKTYTKIEFICSAPLDEIWGMDDIVYGGTSILVGF